MKVTARFGRIVLGAVFLLAAGCFGGDGDDFEPAPGAHVAVGELAALIEAAVGDAASEVLFDEPIEAEEVQDPRPSCFEVEVGSCSVDTGESILPGHSFFYRDADGNEVGISLRLAVDGQQAGDMVESYIDSLKSIETQAWRKLSSQSSGPIASGPCDRAAEPSDDAGCAWQDRDAPGVGDSARALRSNVVPESGYAAVAFARETLYAYVTVRQYQEGTPGGLADGIAEALDAQIKLALSP